jgi:putative Mg2+ transporter-C (MgtC) family protein
MARVPIAHELFQVLHRLLEELPSIEELLTVVWRMAVAALAGGAMGWERQRARKAAGLRTHILVAVGAALFILPFVSISGDAASRVGQGIVTGIGFLGAGSILKLPEQDRIHGLTTAGTVWITAAIGVTAALGRAWMVIVAVIVAWLVLRPLERLAIEHENKG